MEFKEQLEQSVAQVEKVIRSYLPAEEGPQSTVLEAMNYSVLAGGKRLRPLLMRETFRLFENVPAGYADDRISRREKEVLEPFMAAIEMIHTYSLVHDDLPAMDNDMYRRGKKTTHAVYGETMGILAGDALLNYAFETAARAFDAEISPRVAQAFKILAAKAGIYGMIGGQVVDIESENKEVGIETIEYIHENKTAAMIESSMGIGAVLAGASQENRDKIEKIASDVGLAFQIQDDILDVTSTTEVLGKPVGSDDRNHKVTYVTLKGLNQAKKDVKEISERALGILESLPVDNPFLTELIWSLITREY